eukprot:Skav233144  [mRNA]  locus=scaffold1669:22862:23317:- [translate_table: standard]
MAHHNLPQGSCGRRSNRLINYPKQWPLAAQPFVSFLFQEFQLRKQKPNLIDEPLQIQMPRGPQLAKLMPKVPRRSPRRCPGVAPQGPPASSKTVIKASNQISSAGREALISSWWRGGRCCPWRRMMVEWFGVMGLRLEGEWFLLMAERLTS